MSRNKVLQHTQSLAEVRGNRCFDNRTIRLGHQTAHTGQLTNLCCRTTRAGVSHHVDRIERLLHHGLAILHASFSGNTIYDGFGTQLIHHGLGNHIACAAPDIHNLVVALAIRHQTRGVLCMDFHHFFFCSRNQIAFFRRHQHVINANRNAGAGCISKTGIHQLIRHDNGVTQPALTEAGVDQLGNFLFLQSFIDQRKRQTGRQHFGQQRTTDCRVMAHQFFYELAICILMELYQTHNYLGLQCHFTRLIGARNFGNIGEHRTFALGADIFSGHVVQTQHDILRRNNNRLAVCGGEHVVGCEQQGAALHLRFQRERHVYCHLIAVEVGVECRTNQRVQLYRLAFDQNRLERLDTQTVQGRCAVQHHRMLAYHFFENIPDNRLFRLYHPF